MVELHDYVKKDCDLNSNTQATLFLNDTDLGMSIKP